MPDSTQDSESLQPPDDSAAHSVEIQLQDLNVSAGGRPLLQKANARFAAGDVTLIVGCSGVGKSVLLRILADLIDPLEGAIQYSGSIRRNVAGDDNPEASPSTAVVFQSFALFDELTPLENVEIALDHAKTKRPNGQSSRARAAELLKQLGVPTDRPVAVLSGGQQQRLAIARAIAMETDVVLYDEPTSGLDAATGERVAELIRGTQQQYRRTSVIVTHDFEALQSIADHIYVLNHPTRSLEEAPREGWSKLREAIGTPPPADLELLTTSGWLQRGRENIRQFFQSSGKAMEELFCLPWSLLPIWASVRWGLRSTRHYLGLVAGPSACIYIVVAGVILGFVSQDFIFRYLPFRQYTEPLLIENLLHATGFSLYRFLVPILCTILIAARSGAAVAADVGSKVYGNQMDAMHTIGMNPRRSMRTPILYAFLLGTPFLTLISYAAASLTAGVAFLATHAEDGMAFWDAHFHKELRDPSAFLFHGTDWLMAKLVCCAAGIAMIAWDCGSSPKKSGPEISTGVTRTILWSTLFVLTVHFVFSLIEFNAVK